MADAFIQYMLEKLNLLIQKQFGLIWVVDKEMERLSSLLSTIQAVLEDAEEQQIRDKVLQNWLRKLKDAAYKVDDILDECATEAARFECNGQNSSFINKSLKIDDFPSLLRFSREDGRERFPCLTSIDIIRCPELTLPHLPSVKWLWVSDLTEGIQHLSCLETLYLRFFPELVSLPDGIKYLTSLHYLQLSGSDYEVCASLTVLPKALQYVPALRSLDISYYPNLVSLPHWLGDLISL